jgi:hypothetical protein
MPPIIAAPVTRIHTGPRHGARASRHPSVPKQYAVVCLLLDGQSELRSSKPQACGEAQQHGPLTGRRAFPEMEHEEDILL